MHTEVRLPSDPKPEKSRQIIRPRNAAHERETQRQLLRIELEYLRKIGTLLERHSKR
ncbi:MAG: hypothetical protein KDC70_00035 [Saprospiraceae bacterium]|nr:hypothetical protein [Saprospiraceae bacterium]